MNDSMNQRLIQSKERFEELERLLGTPEVVQDQNTFRSYSKEYAQLEPIIRCFERYQQLQQTCQQASEMMSDSDPEMRALAFEESKSAQAQLEKIEQELHIHLLPKDPHDSANIYLEIRAGTGGDEACLFVGDLFRMYSRYSENKNWQIEVISAHEGDHGGYKEIIARISGDNVYSQLKFESGAHRVQRVPTTESQGRIHTSACTVAVLPEVEQIAEVNVDNSDLRIDTFRASGAGGQHVNKTDSAIRITHLPTGIVVECQDERSQHKNKAKAMSLLQAKMLDIEQSKQAAERAQTRKTLVGSGDRSERIRTYNYPQGRVTDHRVNLTLYKLEDIVQGDLDPVIQPLVQEHQTELLSEIGA